MYKVFKKHILKLVVGLTLILTLALAVWVSDTATRLESFRAYDFNVTRKQSDYSIQKLEFCYNYAIKPCHDEKILDWNDTHPDNTFTLITPPAYSEKSLDVFEPIIRVPQQ